MIDDAVVENLPNNTVVVRDPKRKKSQGGLIEVAILSFTDYDADDTHAEPRRIPWVSYWQFPMQEQSGGSSSWSDPWRLPETADERLLARFIELKITEREAAAMVLDSQKKAAAIAVAMKEIGVKFETHASDKEMDL